MNKKQWLTFAGTLFLASVFFIYMAMTAISFTTLGAELDSAAWIRSAIYGSFGATTFAISMACFISGFWEK